MLKHKPTLIASLAKDTREFFLEADKQLAAIKDDQTCGKWRKYLQLKDLFYNSYTYCYHGLSLLADEKCGPAVSCLRFAKSEFLKCEKLCKEYRSSTGAGHTVKPDEAIFFLNYGKELARALEKAERENGFIYHDKIPDTLPDLGEMKATHGLAAPEPYHITEKSERWNAELLAAFDLSQKSEREERREKNKESREKIPDIKEPDVKITKDNACSIM